MFAKRKDIQKPSFNLKLGVKVTNLVQPSVMQEFQTVDCSYIDGDEKRVAKSYVDDIYLLFNQQRLLSAGKDTIQAWLNTLTPKSDALDALRKKCSDSELMAICKSRYIQSPSELLAWSEYLNANYDKIIQDAKLAKDLADLQAKEAAEKAAKEAADKAAASGSSSSAAVLGSSSSAAASK